RASGLARSYHAFLQLRCYLILDSLKTPSFTNELVGDKYSRTDGVISKCEPTCIPKEHKL
ncbi:hypothetical protein ACJX0J_006382, partial [Zea mays]